MTTFGIILSHVNSSEGIKVDKAKVKIISKLPSSKTIREVHSFLGHAGFYRRFIKDFSVISRPLYNLLIKDTPFEWTKDCQSALIIQPLDCSFPFELMCDTSDYVVGVVLGQIRKDKSFVIYYVSRTLNNAQMNYTTTEKRTTCYNICIR